MKILTELSGYGHYGICSIVPPEIVEELNKHATSFPEWQNPNFLYNPPSRTGIEFSLICRQQRDDEIIHLDWSPYHLADAMKSISILNRFGLLETTQKRGEQPFSDPALELNAYPISLGWDVKANFGDPIWDVIECEAFQQMLPAINRQIQFWWQDQDNDEMHGQYASVFKGIDGPTLQVLQPSGGGLWIVGSRQNSHGSYQLADHNTDNYRQAFAHVYSLCIILDHCRRHLQVESYQIPDFEEDFLEPPLPTQELLDTFIGPGQEGYQYEEPSID